MPLTVPHMLTALRVALGVAWATLVASELIAAQQGLGALIQNAASFFQLDIIYVGIICIGLIALAMDLVLRAVARRLRVLAGADRVHDRSRAVRIAFDRVSVEFPSRDGPLRVVDDVTLRDPRPRVRLGHRPVRLRQDDDDEHRRRVRAADRRPVTARRQAGRGPGARSRRDLPGVRRVPVADGAREHRVRPEARARTAPSRRARRDLRALHAADGPRRLRRRVAEDAVRRHAPAAGARARLRGASRSSC